MNRAKRLYILLGVLAAACIAAFAVLHLEQRQEEIAESGETVLEIDPGCRPVPCPGNTRGRPWPSTGTATAGSTTMTRPSRWTGRRSRSCWGSFEAFGAAFVITNVEDYAQYGLDDPTCTIQLATEEESYTIELGNYSNMDEQRYVSTGDGNVYLAVSDPPGRV